MDVQFSTDSVGLREYLLHNRLICDGAMGTYYSVKYDKQSIPELDNTACPENIKEIHKEYIQAGARLIRTNTFASNTSILNCKMDEVIDNISHACDIAKEAASNKAYIAGDIGPVGYDNNSQDIIDEYIKIADVFIRNKVDAIIFETFPALDDILPAIHHIKNNSDIFVIVQFAVNQFGYSNAGRSARRLLQDALGESGIDAAGFNCGVGPGHMYTILSQMDLCTDKYITSLPNSGYPQNVGNRMMFLNNNKDYFVDKICDIAGLGVDIIGGCCGTTPEYIKNISQTIDTAREKQNSVTGMTESDIKPVINNAFYKDKKSGQKLIAVELAPPFGSDDNKLMEAAHSLKKSGVDVLTFPDSPSGRTRADAILMAEKVERETGICVMPHLCCRDKNAIAIRSQLLGAHINNINNFLVVTGDPIPSVMRQSVKSVFNFDSVGLMKIIADMNEEQFKESPLVYGGAINHTRKNLDVEINRVKKKMAAGATFFFTQPAFTGIDVDRIRHIKNKTGATILCGIMPLVSYKNALFMKNEMTGINITDEVIARYDKEADKKQGEAVGIQIAKEIIDLTKDFVDGYYFSFPFNRVYMLESILN